MKNWLTTAIGAIAAVGIYLSHSANATLQTIGNVAQIVGTFLLGGAAKDASNKS